MALRMIWKVGPALGSAIRRIHFLGSYGAFGDWVEAGEAPVAARVLEADVFVRLNSAESPVARDVDELEPWVVEVFSVVECAVADVEAAVACVVEVVR